MNSSIPVKKRELIAIYILLCNDVKRKKKVYSALYYSGHQLPCIAWDAKEEAYPVKRGQGIDEKGRHWTQVKDGRRPQSKSKKATKIFQAMVTYG